MTEWYCEIVRIGKVEKHPNADALEITHVMGDYPVVMKLGQFKEGDLASYIAIDTVCDLTRPEFSFLEKPRIKAKRLRGFYSQGLLISAPEGFTEGQSVVDYFGLKKYVYEEEVLDILSLSEEDRAKYFIPKYDRSVNLSKTISASAESPPAGWSALYYDLESVRKYKYLLIDGEEVVITEKLEGSNVHFRHDGNRLWTKSRNQYKKFNEKDHFWEAAIRYDLEEKLAKYTQYGFYGELIGRISPFFYDCELINGAVQTKLKFFDIYDYNQNKFLEYDDMMIILNDLELETPPLLYRGPWSYSKEILDLAEQDCQLRGNIPKSTMLREGLVIRPTRHHNNRARVVLKYKGEKYNLFK